MNQEPGQRRTQLTWIFGVGLRVAFDHDPERAVVDFDSARLTIQVEQELSTSLTVGITDRNKPDDHALPRLELEKKLATWERVYNFDRRMEHTAARRHTKP